MKETNKDYKNLILENNICKQLLKKMNKIKYQYNKDQTIIKDIMMIYINNTQNYKSIHNNYRKHMIRF